MASNPGALRWKLMKKIVQSVQLAGGTVFGGYVRDSILHDHCATEFYSKAEHTSRYSDESYMPETAMRTCVPRDIDCFMLSENLEKFKADLEGKMLEVHTLNETGTNMYFGGFMRDKITHTKLRVRFAMNHLLRAHLDTTAFEVCIDVLHSSIDGEPPFKRLDFDCNAIVLTQHNDYRLCGLVTVDGPYKKLCKTSKIIEQIVNREARVSGTDVCPKRVEHMLNKMWKVQGPKTLAYRLATETEDTCPICIERYKRHDAVVVNRCCPGSRMHRYCAAKVLAEDFTKCTICRKPMEYTEADKKIIGEPAPWKPLGLTNAAQVI